MHINFCYLFVSRHNTFPPDFLKGLETDLIEFETKSFSFLVPFFVVIKSIL